MCTWLDKVIIWLFKCFQLCWQEAFNIHVQVISARLIWFLVVQMNLKIKKYQDVCVILENMTCNLRVNQVASNSPWAPKSTRENIYRLRCWSSISLMLFFKSVIRFFQGWMDDAWLASSSTREINQWFQWAFCTVLFWHLLNHAVGGNYCDNGSFF